MNTDFKDTAKDEVLETNIEKVKRNLDFDTVEHLSENDGCSVPETHGEEGLDESPPSMIS